MAFQLGCSTKAPAPSHGWKKLAGDLYTNGSGELGFKASELIGPNGTREDYFITKFHYNEGAALATIVDTATVEYLGGTFYRDKTHVYLFYALLAGGDFRTFEADRDSFEVLVGDCYAKDKHSIYEMRRGRLENVDYATFKAAPGPGCFAKDKHGYYSWSEKLASEQLGDADVQAAIKKLDE